MSAPTTYVAPANGWRTFLIIWTTQSLSVFGSALTSFATTIWLTQIAFPLPEQRAELGFALAAQGLAFGIPTMLLAPIAGAWADRHSRKAMMLIADAVNGVVSLALIALLLAGALNVVTLIVLTAMMAACTTFHSAGFDTSYAMLVPEEKLPRANGMMQTIWSLSAILSPALAATIIALPTLARQGSLFEPLRSALAPLESGVPLAFALDVLTFVIAAGTLLFLRVPSPVRAELASSETRPSLWADVGEGASYIWRRKPILWLLGTFTLANFVSAPTAVFVPLILKFNLAGDWAAQGFTFETALALLVTLTSVGGVVGGVFISVWGGLKRRRVYGVLVAMIISGLAQVVFGLSPFFYLTALMGFLTVAMIPIMNAHSQAIWQSQVPHELQGRVFAVRRVIAQFTYPVSTLLAGLSVGLFNPGVVMATLGATLALFCAAQFFNPYLLRVEDKAYLDALAERHVARA